VSSPRFTQPDDQFGDQGRVLGRALHQRQWVLGAVDVDPQGDHATVFAEVHAIDHERDQVQPDSSADSNAASAVSVCATNRRDTADLDVAVAAVSARTPTGSSPAP
jgi:hypothetical protein